MNLREPHTPEMREQRDNIAAVEPPMIDYTMLEAHELAAIFDMIEDGGNAGKATFDGLKASIASEGLHQPITLYEGRILDGRNRHKAALEVGYPLSAKDFKTFDGTYDAARRYVIDVNGHRRHLTKGQTEKVIKKLIEAYPDKSNRDIAKLAGVSHTLVNTVKSNLSQPSESDRAYDKFAKAWSKLDAALKVAFAREFAPELRKLISTL